MSARRGFTLIEIILATVLFSLLMSTYYEVFSSVVTLEEYARESRSFANVAPAVLDLIEDDLHSLYVHPAAQDAFPFRGNDETVGSQPADNFDFVGSRQSIAQEEFFGQDKWTHSPINELGYRVARSATSLDTRRLYRRESFYVDSTPLEGGDYYEVYDRVYAFNIEYVGYRVEEENTNQESEQRELETFESWDSEERRGYPTAVIVTLTIEAPQLTIEEPREGEERERRTFIRIIPFVQGDDVAPPQTNPGSQTPGNNPGNTPANPGR